MPVQAGSSRSPTRRPAKSSARCPTAVIDDATDAIAAADAAFGAWSNTTARTRADLLYSAWQLMLERADALAELMTREQGKPIKASRAEVAYAADFLRFYAEEATRVAGEWLPSARADQRFLVLRQPVGVVAMVTPWNYPISMLTRKMGPALAAGCTLVLKPAEATPLCARAVFEIFADVGLPGRRRQPRDGARPRADRRRVHERPACSQTRVHRFDRRRATARGRSGRAI